MRGTNTYLGSLLHEGLRGKEKRVINELTKAIVEENGVTTSMRHDVLAGLKLTNGESSLLKAMIVWMDNKDRNFVMLKESLVRSDLKSFEGLMDRNFIIRISTDDGEVFRRKASPY